jgi:hypothetical protein
MTLDKTTTCATVGATTLHLKLLMLMALLKRNCNRVEDKIAASSTY